LKSIAVSGSPGKDVQIKIDSVEKLPPEFRRYIKRTVGYSRISEAYGPGWSMDKVFKILEERSVQPSYYSYGGRAPNVAYGVGRLGGDVRLITVFGDDFNEPYPGFYDGGYLTHLRNAGIKIDLLDVEVPGKIWGKPEEMRSHLEGSYGDALYRCDALRVRSKEIPTIVCAKDVEGVDFYYIDDIKGVSTVDLARPAPTEIVEKVDIVFVTSSEMPFMKEMILAADRLGKEVVVDIGSYGITPEYLRETVPHSTIVFGNTSEIQQVLNAFQVEDIPALYERIPEDPFKMVLVEDKIEGTVEVFSRDGGREMYGPIKIKKTGNSVGCCDGIAAGFLSLYQRGSALDLCIQAGLVECAAIWEIETIHERLLDRKELISRYASQFGDASRIEKALR